MYLIVFCNNHFNISHLTPFRIALNLLPVPWNQKVITLGLPPFPNTVKPLNNGPPEERPLVNNGQILIALAYFNTFATLKGGHTWISNNGQQNWPNNGQ